MPPPPDSEEGEKPNLQFAVVECALFTFHQLLKLVRKEGRLDRERVTVFCVSFRVQTISLVMRKD